MRVLVAPDSFGGTLSAVQAAEAMAAGWLAHAPGDRVVRRPLSDGGPGLLDALSASLAGELRAVTVTGPTGDPVPGAVLVVAASEDPSGRSSAYVESAQACGLHLVEPADRRPADATSRGVGELLLAAVGTGAERVVVGLGGSGTVDGGAGVLAALGVRAPGRRLDRGLAGLAGLDTPIEGLAQARDQLAGVELVCASDVDVPLLGRHGAVQGFGPQKGATGGQLPGLEAAMLTLAGAVVEAAGRAEAHDPGRLVALPGAGAAGGVGFALLALGASRVSGAQAVIDAVGLSADLAACDVVLSGEGSFGWQSLRGTVVAGVAHAAVKVGVPVVVVAGQVSVGRRELAVSGIDAAYAVATTPEELARSFADPAGGLSARVRRVARTWHVPEGSGPGNSTGGRSIDG